jgi:hypothetical protein
MNDYSTSVYLDEPWDLTKAKFLGKYEAQDYISVKESYIIEKLSLYDFIQDIKNYLTKRNIPSVINGVTNGVLLLLGDGPVIVHGQRHRVRTTDKGGDAIECEITAEPTICAELTKYLDAKYLSDEATQTHWWFKSKEGGISSVGLNMKNKYEVYPEFYPWLKREPEEYFTKYLEHDAPLLFVSGPPGTGKTSFLRYMICKHKLHCYVGYDPKLFDNDEMFINFVSSDDIRVLVMEDAEALVMPRNKGGNDMMSRFLNVSDGLIKFPDKKVIFTTNESNFENVDPALIRPGRCYDFLQFRELNYEEAHHASKVANLPVPPLSKRQYTLAELFNSDERHGTPVNMAVGFY